MNYKLKQRATFQKHKHLCWNQDTL